MTCNRKRLHEQPPSGGLYFTPSAGGFFSSGCALLDCVLGGGWAIGRIANIVGDQSTGKTLLAIEAAANFARQHPGCPIWYNETESAFDAQYAASLGLPLDSVTFVDKNETVEDLFESLSQCVSTMSQHKHGLYIVDSLDALSDRAEMGAAIDAGGYNINKAKMLSHAFRRITREVEKAGLTVLIVSQVRTKIGVTFGKKTTRSGGRALDFYASQVIYLSQVAVLKREIHGESRPVGIVIKAKCTKNKAGLPFREAEMPVRFLYGIDDVAAHLKWLGDMKILTVSHPGMTLSKARELSEQDFLQLRQSLAEEVKKRWIEIEKEAAPERSKYGTIQRTEG